MTHHLQAKGATHAHLYSDATAKCSWTVMEPAVEVFSACLPTMAPLLHARVRLLESLKSTFRSLIRFRGSPTRSTSPIPSQYDCEANNDPGLRPDLHDRIIVSKASAKTPYERDTDSDEIPLRGIKVERDLHSAKTGTWVEAPRLEISENS